MKHREEKELRKSIYRILEAENIEVQELPEGHEKEIIQRVKRWAEDF